MLFVLVFPRSFWCCGRLAWWGAGLCVCFSCICLFVLYVLVFVIFRFLLVSGLAVVCDCGIHWTFLLTSCMASQDYFTLLSYGKQVDGTEDEVLHREPHHHLQAHRGFLTSSPNGLRTCSDTAAGDQRIRSQCL